MRALTPMAFKGLVALLFAHVYSELAEAQAVPPPLNASATPQCLCGCCDCDTTAVRVAMTLTGVNGGVANLGTEAKSVYHAVCLTITELDSRRTFTFGLAHWQAALIVADDEGDSALARSYYRTMANISDVFLLPPDAGLAAAILEDAEDIGRPLMAYNAGVLELPSSSSQVLRFDVPARRYFVESLTLLYGAGARSIGTLQDATSSMYVEMCGAALEHARSLGMAVAYNGSQTGDFEDARMIVDIGRLSPDVFLVCLPRTRAAEAVQGARSVLWSPAAILLAEAVTDLVGAANALYTLSPLTWHSSLDSPCRVWGRSGSFVDAFRQKYDAEPSALGVRAMSAVIVLLQAAEAAGTRTLVARRDIVSVEVNTTFGEVRFFQNGSLQQPAIHSMQEQRLLSSSSSSAESELNETESKFASYLSTRQVLLNEALDVLYPAPETWEERELEVYPCSPGYQVHWVGENAVECQQCPAGYERDDTAVSCQRCRDGFYTTQSGAAQCILCPPGTNCQDTPPGEVPRAAAGYYLMPELADDGGWVYGKCSPVDICLSGNVCDDDNRGVLCGRCKPGYSNSRVVKGSSRKCSKCPEVIVVVVLLGLVLLAYTAFLCFLVFLSLAAARSAQAIHSAIMKSVVNHIHLIMTTIVACEFEAGFITHLARALMDPFSETTPIVCLFPSDTSSAEPELIDVFVGMVLLPVVLMISAVVIWARYLWKRYEQHQLAKMKFAKDTEEDDNVAVQAAKVAAQGATVTATGVVLASTAAVQAGQLATKALQDSLHTYGTPEAEAMAKEASALPSSQAKDAFVWENPPEADGDTSEKAHMTTDIGNVFPRAMGGGYQSTQTLRQMMAERFTRWMIMWVFVLQPVVVVMLVSVMRCSRVDVLRMVNNYDITCKSERYSDIYWLAFAGLAIYGFLIPWFEFLMVRRAYKRDELMYLQTRRKLGFLYNGYEPYYYFYDMLSKWAKAIFIIVSSHGIRDYRCIYMLAFYASYATMSCMATPHDNRDFFLLDSLQFRSSLSIIFLLLMRITLDFRGDVPTTSDGTKDVLSSSALHITMVVLCICAELWFWAGVERGLIRNMIMRHLVFKKRVWVPKGEKDDDSDDEMDPWSCLMNSCADSGERQRTGLFTVDLQTNKLDLAELTAKERSFFLASLGDTMEHFVNSGRDFHPGQLSQAVNLAARRCIRDREERTRRLYEIQLAREQSDGSWRSILALFFAEAEQAVYGMGLELGQEKVVEGEDLDGEQSPHLPAGGGAGEDIEDRNLARKKQAKQQKRKLDMMKKARESKFTVDEMHSSLMLCWPEIADRERQDDRIFKLNKYELAEDEEKRKKIPKPETPSADAKVARLDGGDAELDTEDVYCTSARAASQQLSPGRSVRGDDMLKKLGDIQDGDLRAMEQHEDALQQSLNMTKFRVQNLQEEIKAIQQGQLAPEMLPYTPSVGIPPSPASEEPIYLGGGPRRVQQAPTRLRLETRGTRNSGSMSPPVSPGARMSRMSEQDSSATGGTFSPGASPGLGVPGGRRGSAGGSIWSGLHPINAEKRHEEEEEPLEEMDDVRWTAFMGFELARRQGHSSEKSPSKTAQFYNEEANNSSMLDTSGASAAGQLSPWSNRGRS